MIKTHPFTAYITTLAPRPLTLLRDIPVVITPVGEDFVATFTDGDISSTGDTDEEALSNLRDLIGQLYETLIDMPEAKLGKIPKKQLAVLRTVIAAGA